MSYPKDILSTRAVVKPGLYAILPRGGLVNNVLPGVTGAKVSIVASPKLGASFVQYVIETEAGAAAQEPLCAETGVEGFIYCIEGKADCEAGGEKVHLSAGGYIYVPANQGGIRFSCRESARLLLYKQKYIPLQGKAPYLVQGNVNEIPFVEYEGMKNVFIKDLLPKDIAFDMNMHILSFEPGGCHSFVETHVQEHGAYILSGEGMYIMENEWLPIRKDDFMWFGPYVPQGSYGVGREPFAYIYSKDCNRDVSL